MPVKRDTSKHNGLPPQSLPWLRGFVRYCHWYVRRHFHQVLVLKGEDLHWPEDQPLVIYMNHPSWWDPIMGLLAYDRFFRDRRNHAVIDEAALAQYGFFRKLGFFGVEQNMPRGGAQFLRTSLAILHNGPNVLWLTAEGTFRDPRRRPIELRPGLAHLVRRMSGGLVVPMALEYAFWEESRPEALWHFGKPLAARSFQGMSVEAIGQGLTENLTLTMDQLAAAARERAADRFTPVIAAGSAGVGGVYDLWRRLRAGLRGERFDPRHAAITKGPS